LRFEYHSKYLNSASKMRYGGQLLLPGRESGASLDSVNSNRSHYSNYSQASHLSNKKKFHLTSNHTKPFKPPIHIPKTQPFSEYGCTPLPPPKKHPTNKPKNPSLPLPSPTPLTTRKNLHLSPHNPSLQTHPTFNIPIQTYDKIYAQQNFFPKPKKKELKNLISCQKTHTNVIPKASCDQTSNINNNSTRNETTRSIGDRKHLTARRCSVVIGDQTVKSRSKGRGVGKGLIGRKVAG
jgi:hypothetical protein